MKWLISAALAILLSAFMLPAAVYGFAVDMSCWEDRRGDVETPKMPAAHITLDAVNLRPQPSTAQPRIALAPRGSIVYVTDFLDGEWYAVTYDGIDGYMFAEYLQAIDIDPNQPVDMSELAPVELVEWENVNPLIPRHGIITIIDVRTGITWNMARLGGDFHIDLEPVTAADTAAMYEAFNRTWTWTPRPVLAIWDGRTLAASINGMPHSINSIPNNNVNGHFCLHFFGSRAHGSPATVSPQHHDAVMEAYLTTMERQAV